MPGNAVNVATTVALVVCAVISTGIVVRREFVSSQVTEFRPKISVSAAQWDSAAGAGTSLGGAGAVVTIVTFSDFECPACRGFAGRALQGVRHDLGDSVRIVFRHLPLPYHRMAEATAQAAECAGEQRRFWEFHDLIFRKQDSLGLKSFESFAEESGVLNVPAFAVCLKSGRHLESIRFDVRFAQSLGLPGTPTVLINGSHFPAASDSVLFQREVRRLLVRGTR